MKSTRRLIIIAIILVVVVIGYVLVLKMKASVDTNSSATGGVLTVSDLDKPDVKLNSETSNASVENLTKELKAKIDKQIAAKENPFETVSQLVEVLAATTNTTRQDQLSGFVADFLAKHKDSLSFAVGSETPDQAQVHYWESSLYAKLVYNYQFMMQNQFTGSDGKPINTTQEQLKYINLYLALANDPASQSRATDEYRNAPLAYAYSDADYFEVLKSDLTVKRE